jgi:hypothetical protein
VRDNGRLGGWARMAAHAAPGIAHLAQLATATTRDVSDGGDGGGGRTRDVRERVGAVDGRRDARSAILRRREAS